MGIAGPGRLVHIPQLLYIDPYTGPWIFQEKQMPTYEYECTKCGHTFEALQSISADPLKECPQCKGRLRRLIGGGMGVIFKGSGFYTTDYKKTSTLSGGNGSAGKDGAAKPEASKTADKPKEAAAGKSDKS